MGEQKPVIVYAASGYTGRLTCESLTKLRIPFVAAGRNQERLDAIVAEMRGLGADCTSAVVQHTPAGLQQAFRGAKIVINNSGPFSLLGRVVVEAALSEGCHYLDSTGEQDFMLDMRRDFDARFDSAKLLLSPSTAFLWAVGNTAAEICLETPGIDTVKVMNAAPPLQTVASLQSMVRSGRRPGYVIQDQKLVLAPTGVVRHVVVADTDEIRLALSIGAGDATFFMGDPRVRNCETLFVSNELAQSAGMMKLWSGMSKYVSGETLDRWSDALVLKYKKDPPPERPETARFVVMGLGFGNHQRVSVTIRGVCPYVVTGFLAAMSSQALLEGKAQRFGYASMAQAFGARYVLRRLAEQGTHAQIEVTSAKDASSVSSAGAAGMYVAHSA